MFVRCRIKENNFFFYDGLVVYVRPSRTERAKPIIERFKIKIPYGTSLICVWYYVKCSSSADNLRVSGKKKKNKLKIVVLSFETVFVCCGIKEYIFYDAKHFMVPSYLKLNYLNIKILLSSSSFEKYIVVLGKCINDCI